MREGKIEALKKELTIITRILINAQEAFLIVDYLYKPELENNVSYQKGMNAFFGYSKFIYWQILIIELAKLFYFNEKDKEKTGKREKFSIRQFLKKIGKDGDFYQEKISEEKIKLWYDSLNNEDEIIKNLLKQRDKLYAHEDGEKIENIVSLNKVSELLKIVCDIIREINLSVFERGIDFKPIPSPVDNLKYIVGQLAQSKSI